MTSYIYCRVSTRAQGDGVSLEAQESVCRDKVSADGGRLAGVVFETASGYLSGMRNKLVRKELKKVFQPSQKQLHSLLTTAAKNSKIYFYHADRLSRNLENLQEFQLLAAKKNLTFVVGNGDEWLTWRNGDDDSDLVRLVRQGENESKRIGARVRANWEFVYSHLQKIGLNGVPYSGGRPSLGKKIVEIDIHGKKVKVVVDDEEYSEAAFHQAVRDMYDEIVRLNPDYTEMEAIKETRRCAKEQKIKPGRPYRIDQIMDIVKPRKLSFSPPHQKKSSPQKFCTKRQEISVIKSILLNTEKPVLRPKSSRKISKEASALSKEKQYSFYDALNMISKMLDQMKLEKNDGSSSE